MALVFCDGIDSYAATADLSKKWASVGAQWSWNSTAGKNGTGGIVGSSTGASVLKSNSIFGNALRVGFGFWYKCATTPAASASLLQVLNSGNVEQVKLSITTAGLLFHSTPGGGTQFTGGTNICDGSFHWIEWLPQSGNSINQRCHVDGVQQWNGLSSGASNTWSLGADSFQFVTIAGEASALDDIIAYDNTAGMESGDYPLGAREITTLRPTSDSAVQFARSTGADNFALIDEVNGDIADYVQSGTSSQQDLYGYGNLGFTPAVVNAVMLNSYLHNPNAGTINYKQIAKSSATTTEGASAVTPSAARVVQQPFETDPNGAIAWTGAAVDAALFGIKVV